MRKLLGILLFCTAKATLPSEATTYNYMGQDLQCFSFGCFSGGQLRGAVNFSADTTAFTGSLSLSAGDTASFNAPGFFSSVRYPNSQFTISGSQFIDSLTGTFTFVDGNIVGWSLDGSFAINPSNLCGGGPACVPSVESFDSGPAGDSVTGLANSFLPMSTFAESFGPGTWTAFAAAVKFCAQIGSLPARPAISCK